MSNPSIIHSDYMSADSIMMSAATLRDKIFHNKVVKSNNKRVESQPVTITNRTKKFLLSEEDFEAENIQICIQNDDKLINYLSTVKKKYSVDAVVYTTQSVITILIRAYVSHPVLIIRCPIDGEKVYSRQPGLVYMLPINDIMSKSTASFSTANGYALYFKKTVDNESKQVITSIHYKVASGSAYVPMVQETNIRFVNILLHPSSTQETKISMRRNDEDNIAKLDDMIVLMLVDVRTLNSFKDIDKEQNINFSIALNDSGVLTMTMISRFVEGSTVERPIVDETTAKIWQFKSPTEYIMYPRTSLLVQSVNGSIKLGTHFLYFAFCKYGSEYAFMKIVSAKAITVASSSPGILLSKLLEGTSYVMEMYFCHQ